MFRQGVPDDRKIWSATAVVHSKYHSTLQQVHQSFLQAGSDAITTNSYGIIPGYCFEKIPERSQLLATSGRIARQAVDESKYGFVLGSLSPLVESYRPDLIKETEEGIKDYQIACEALSKYVDAFLAETMSCVEESKQAIQAVSDSCTDKHDPPMMMVSFTLEEDGNFRDGEDITKGIRRLLVFSKDKPLECKFTHLLFIYDGHYSSCTDWIVLFIVLAILFNCCTPEAISKALKSIHQDQDLLNQLQEAGIVLGAYANKLTVIEPEWSLAEYEGAQAFRKDLDPKHYNDFVQNWIETYGIRVVGGCCGTTPEHIAYIQQNLNK